MRCWGCGTEASGGDLCPACGELEPFPAATDHFSIFGLPRKLGVDLELLERRFYALSRRFHPDFYQTKSAGSRSVSLENSARLNQAYRTLRDSVTRVEYLLELEGLPAGTPSNPPSELFEEILELQDARQEYRATRNPELRERLESAYRDLAARKTALEEELHGLFGEWDRLPPGAMNGREAQRKLLERMRGILAIRAYLRTVIRDIAEDVEGP